MIEIIGIFVLLLNTPVLWIAFTRFRQYFAPSILLIATASVFVTLGKFAFIWTYNSSTFFSTVSLTLIEDVSRAIIAVALFGKYASMDRVKALIIAGYIYGIVELYVNYNSITIGSTLELFGYDFGTSIKLSTALFVSLIYTCKPLIHALILTLITIGIIQKVYILSLSTAIIHASLNLYITGSGATIYDLSTLNELVLAISIALILLLFLAFAAHKHLLRVDPA